MRRVILFSSARNATDGKGHDIDPDSVAKRDAVLGVLHREQTVRESCRSLPFTIVMWLTFIIVSIGHRQVPTVHRVRGALDSMIKKPTSVDPELVAAAAVCANITLQPRRLRSSGGGAGGGARKPDDPASASVSVASFEQISSFVDAMNWAQTSFIQVLWQGSGRVNYYYRALGGMHLTFEETKLEACTKSKYLAEFYGKDCRSLEDNAPSTTEMWLDLRNPAANESFRTAETFCGPRLLSPAMTGMKAESLLYNGEVAFLVLVTASFSQETDGYFKTKLKFCELGEIYSSWTKHIGDIVWYALLLWFVVSELMRVGRARVKKTPWLQILDKWTMTNIAFLVGSVGVGGFWIYFSQALQSVGDDIHRHSGDLNKIREVYNRVGNLCAEQGWNETFLWWYSQLLLVKFFQAFQVNARLSVISTTIKESARELMHFVLVFGLIFANYSLGAHLLFGKHIKEWSTFRGSVNMCFLVLMGDFDYGAMHAVAPVSSQLWFWSFMMLVFMVMLNMMLVIIMDVYGQVKDRVGNSETLYQQARTLVETHLQDIQMLGDGGKESARKKKLKKIDYLWKDKVMRELAHPGGVVVMDDDQSEGSNRKDQKADFVNAKTLVEMGCPTERRALLLITKAGARAPPKEEDAAGDAEADEEQEVDEPEPESAPVDGAAPGEAEVDVAELRSRLDVLSKQMKEIRTQSGDTWAKIQEHLELMVLQHDIGRVPEVWSTKSLGICTKLDKGKHQNRTGH